MRGRFQIPAANLGAPAIVPGRGSGSGSGRLVSCHRARDARPTTEVIVDAGGRTMSAGSQVADVGDRRTILLVEDEENVRRLTRLALERGGYRVLGAVDAAEALAMVGSADGPLDMVVTDYALPHMSGRELVDQLRARQPHLKVLFMSGMLEDLVVNDDATHDAHFLQKPFTLKTFSEKVRSMLQNGA